MRPLTDDFLSHGFPLIIVVLRFWIVFLLRPQRSARL